MQEEKDHKIIEFFRNQPFSFVEVVGILNHAL
jgi:hypothetical protein